MNIKEKHFVPEKENRELVALRMRKVTSMVGRK